MYSNATDHFPFYLRNLQTFRHESSPWKHRNPLFWKHFWLFLRSMQIYREIENKNLGSKVVWRYQILSVSLTICSNNFWRLLCAFIVYQWLLMTHAIWDDAFSWIFAFLFLFIDQPLWHGKKNEWIVEFCQIIME